MIQSNAFNYINVLNKAADASWTRNQLLSNNLSNVSTPNYKRRDIEFQTYLARQLQGEGSLDKKVSKIDLNSLEPTVYTDYSTLSYRLDGNNVDVDTESANLAQNQIRFNAIMDSMTSEFNRIKLAITSK
ncbi:flagellar basal-body rod protein FlgB [Anaerocolumna cellulosilytica]|uniref:Flagellar basal body rod protein FlgB n=1 Tax=Anaerocolumna cellulosilytica TaxID=433286 RepID=A0A6S6QVH5_9FIRM|nr:flagellar basal body rod protein FlgB [Anaerocolumna cellulosilytica]MBB5197039.1 flagellar basal-body rod protein FlgB [Anaerocolumna cellulosilytica]BCJ95253.1 flagellar basal-body rod protein FlgB [Anaerocolumna cellulosilytica]